MERRGVEGIRLVSRVIALTVLQWDGQYDMRLWFFPDLIWCQRFGRDHTGERGNLRKHRGF